MAYTDNHCDLNRIKDKPICGFTIRQVVCFVIMAIIDIPVYAISIGSGMDCTIACLIICLISAPIFFAGTYEDVHGRPLEKILRDKIRLMFLTESNRPFSTDNRYNAIKKQIKLEEKMDGFVEKKKKRDKVKAAKKASKKSKVKFFFNRNSKKEAEKTA